MPALSLHLLLADRCLEGWRAAPSTAPFPIRDPACAEAFRQGALGPDLGYFPGGVRPFSELVHCFRSADFSRVLLGRADTPVAAAFAAGWVSHVIADQEIHPLVGRGLGALRFGDRTRFVAGDDDPAGHLRVEIGLDAWFSARRPALRERPPVPLPGEGVVRTLGVAYREVYGCSFDRASLHASLLGMLRLAPGSLRTIGMVGDLAARPRAFHARFARGSLERIRTCSERLARRDSLLLSLLSPVLPERWLRDAVHGVVAAFPGRLQESLEEGGRRLENRNLDTGEDDRVASLHHHATRRVLAWIGALRTRSIAAAA